MRSLIGALLRPRNDAPVPYVGRRASSAFGGGGASGSGPLAQMGQVGTLFAIINRTSTAAAAPDWALYRKPKDGKPDPQADRETVTTHAAVSLWANPNPFYTQAALVETVQQHIDLTGEGFLVVVKAGKIPIELWPVRPDRMTPRTDPTKYLLGWTYKTPDGEKIPLDHDEVIQLKMPNPTDPFRGLGPVAALLTELDSSQAAAEWSRNFFRNSAQPGGVIEFPEGLSDEDFDNAREHWAEQHKGVANAHRVAIIEHGIWKTTSFSPKDLDFSALRNLSRDAILEGFGISRATLGMTDGVNFAAAKAARTQFAELLTVPRLERWKQALNSRLLPMFGATSKGVEFDYESPAEADPEVENAERTSRVQSAVALVEAGWNPQSVAEAYGLPEMQFGTGEDVDPDRDLMVRLITAAPAALAPMLLPILLPDVEFPEPPAPVIAPPGPQFGEGDEGPDDATEGDDRSPPTNTARAVAVCSHGHPLRNADDDEPDEDDEDVAAVEAAFRHGVKTHTAPPAGCDCIHVGADLCHIHAVRNADEPDLSAMQSAWEKALAALLAAWEAITAGWRSELRKQITEIVDDGELARLAAMTVDTGDGADRLHEALTAIAATAAQQASDEAADAGVTAPATVPAATDLETTAAAVAAMLGARLGITAGQEALRRNDGDKTGMQVAGEVDAVLREQPDRPQRDAFGPALHGTQNRARAETFAAGPVGSLYATEQLDSSTCSACREVDGRFICNTDDLAPLHKLYTALGGYVDCLGGARCRGSFTGVWRKGVDE